MTPDQLENKVEALEEILGQLLMAIEAAESSGDLRASVSSILEEFREQYRPKRD